MEKTQIEEAKGRTSKINCDLEPCAWCNNKPKYLLKYYDLDKWFCNKGCYIEYTEEFNWKPIN